MQAKIKVGTALVVIVLGVLAASSGFLTPAYTQATARQASNAQPALPQIPPAAQWTITMAQVAQKSIQLAVSAETVGFDLNCYPATDGTANSWLFLTIRIGRGDFGEHKGQATITGACGAEEALKKAVEKLIDEICQKANLPEMFVRVLKDNIMSIVRMALSFK